MAGSGTPAVAAVRAARVEHRVHDLAARLDGSLPAPRAVADALGVAPSRVFKTLVVEADAGAAVAVVPLDRALDLKAFARAIGVKRAALASPAEAERLTGYVLGGISPFGQRRRLPTVVDVSAREHATIFVSGGRRGLELEVTAGDVVALTGGHLAAIAG